MDRLLSVIIILAICTVVKGATIQVLCQNNSACQPGQCCYIKPEFEVVSKRDLFTLPSPGPRNNTGICENYKHRGDGCNRLEKMNGHCGCGGGLSLPLSSDYQRMRRQIVEKRGNTSIYIRKESSSNPCGVYLENGATIQVLCQNDSVCHPGQCCYIKPEFEVASKRDLFTLPPPTPRNNTGICENYKYRGNGCNWLEKMNGHCGCVGGMSWICENYKHRGDGCNWLEKMNGHCGCGGGMTCKWISMGIPPTVAGKRRLRGPDFHTGPGSYQCA